MAASSQGTMPLVATRPVRLAMFARALAFFTAVSTGTSYMLAPGAAPCSARARTAASAMQFGGQQAEEVRHRSVGGDLVSASVVRSV